MSGPSIQFHKIWIEQCRATEDIRERFGLEDAIRYLIGEKLFDFVRASEDDPDFAKELPAFVADIRWLFSAAEIREFLDDLERTKLRCNGLSTPRRAIFSTFWRMSPTPCHRSPVRSEPPELK